jgi:hypothetical protein
MANTTTTTNISVNSILVTYNGVNYHLEADLEIDLDTGDIVAMQDVQGWVCDCYWESVADHTSNLHFAEFEGFQDAVREAAKHRYDIDDVRRELEEE